MIETLFGLERFNLGSRTNILLARSREQHSFLEGRLEELQGLNPELLKEKKAALLEKRESAEGLKKEIEELRKQKKKLDELTELRDRQTALREEFETGGGGGSGYPDETGSTGTF